MSRHVFFVDITRHDVGPVQSLISSAQDYITPFQPEVREWFALQHQSKSLDGQDVHTVSAKGAQLAANPHAAVSFYWREQARQIRVRGQVSVADQATRDADFLARSDASRIASLIGHQSDVLADPAELTHEMEAARQRLAADPQLVAQDHTVYLLTPAEVEFWQGDHQRQHTRLRYRRAGAGWVAERLWP